MVAHAETSGGRIKGEAIRQFLRWYVDKWDQERLFNYVRELPPHAANEFDIHQPHLGVIASSWYPAASFHALIDAMLSGYLPEQRRSFAREAAKATIDATFKGVYRFLFETMMTPDRYAARAQKLFRRFHDTGTITKEAIGPSTHLTRITRWSSHHTVLCDTMLFTGEYVYPMLGCRNVTTHRLGCVATGNAFCSYEIRWERA
jgi:hypothetical protein